MPKQRPDDDAPILLLSDGNVDDDLRVEDAIRAEFNQGADSDEWEVKVSRFEGQGKQEPECFVCTPEDFPITNRLREEHGAGKYRVRVYKNKRMVKFFQYAIEAPRIRQVEATVKGELGQLAQTFQAAMDRQSQMIERLMERLSKPGGDGGKTPTITELVAAMVSMKEFIAPKQEPRAGTSELLQIFKLGIEAGGGAPPVEGTGILGTLERILQSPLIQKIAEGAMSAMPAATSPGTLAVAPPVPRPTNGAARTEPLTATAAEPPNQEQQVQIFMRQQVLYLLGRAHQFRASNQTKSHPDLYAEWVIDNIPGEILNPLMGAPNALQVLEQFVPEVSGFADWFAQLIESVRLELTGEGEEGDNGSSLANGGKGPRPHVSGAADASASVDTGRP